MTEAQSLVKPLPPPPALSLTFLVSEAWDGETQMTQVPSGELAEVPAVPAVPPVASLPLAPPVPQVTPQVAPLMAMGPVAQPNPQMAMAVPSEDTPWDQTWETCSQFGKWMADTLSEHV